MIWVSNTSGSGAPGPQGATASAVRSWFEGAEGQELAYTTVVTVLSRLYGKGLVERVKRGRSFAYVAEADESKLTARRLQKVLDDGPDREAVLVHFVGELSPGDASVLRRLIGSEGREED